MKPNAGNALWFILIAIFLLAALTMLITRTSQQTEETGESERSTIRASELLRDTQGIKNAVDALLLRGCSESELSFWTDENADGLETNLDCGYNAQAPVDKSCHVYDPKGGGAKIPHPNDYCVRVSAIQDVGTASHDLFYTSSYESNSATVQGLSEETCAAINHIMKNGLDITALPEASLSDNAFTGNMSAGVIWGDGGAEVDMAGIKTGCITDTDCNGSACLAFYSVILPR